MTGEETVVKVGGSLGRGESLRGLSVALGRLGEQYPLIIVPGGGVFADTVRDCYRRYALDESTAHRMALLAMDQYGLLLAALIPQSKAVRELAGARAAAAAGQAAILLPADLLWAADPLPHSWQVTSDSLGAWIAGVAGATRYVLLKDVDGLYDSDPADPAARLCREVTVTELAGHVGGVDEYLVTVLHGAWVETWIINGRHPERLGELLATGRTKGTRIVR